MFLFHNRSVLLWFRVSFHFRLFGPQHSVVLDPFGILEEGQIYCHSSVGIIDPETATLFNVLKGEVLVRVVE